MKCVGWKCCEICQSKDAAVAQSVERRIGSAEVTGPIPVSSFIFLPKIQT